MGQAVARRNRLEDEIRQGLKGGQFILEYQPQIDLAHGSVSGAEALLRWQHPQRDRLGPSEFMGVAEDCGLILLLGEWVLNRACAQAKAWENAGLTDFQISVNLSAVQLSQKNLDQLVTDALHRNNLPPQRLNLEITETAVLRSNPGIVDHMLGRLDNLGIDIAIDDFGTGYACLSYLKRFPVSQVKIDRTFVEHLGTNTEDSAIVRAVIGLGHDLNLNVVAEGVETAAQLNALRQAGCDTVQGYFISRPLAPEHFVPWVRSWEAARFRTASLGKPIAVKEGSVEGEW
jgi:EAL domain-containing protein (putative c-di-GMP-specific phosphodiesterase class I)